MIINIEQCFHLRPQNCLPRWQNIGPWPAPGGCYHPYCSSDWTRSASQSCPGGRWTQCPTNWKEKKIANSVQFLNHIKKHKYISLYCLEHQFLKKKPHIWILYYLEPQGINSNYIQWNLIKKKHVQHASLYVFRNKS